MCFAGEQSNEFSLKNEVHTAQFWAHYGNKGGRLKIDLDALKEHIQGVLAKVYGTEIDQQNEKVYIENIDYIDYEEAKNNELEEWPKKRSKYLAENKVGDKEWAFECGARKTNNYA